MPLNIALREVVLPTCTSEDTREAYAHSLFAQVCLLDKQADTADDQVSGASTPDSQDGSKSTPVRAALNTYTSPLTNALKWSGAGLCWEKPLDCDNAQLSLEVQLLHQGSQKQFAVQRIPFNQLGGEENLDLPLQVAPDFLPALGCEQVHLRMTTLRADSQDAQEENLFVHAWEALDSDDESVTITKDDIFGEIVDLEVRRRSSLCPTRSEMDVPLSYDGPEIGHNMTVNTARELLNYFSSSPTNTIPYVHCWSLVERLKALSDQRGAVTEVAIPPNGEVVVVGDLHGQLPDLETVLSFGWPSDKRHFVFNGDFVDRGPQGVAVMVVVFVLRLALPKCVFLNRGNHEHRALNQRYCFMDQVLDTYDLPMFDHISACFAALPLCAVINNSIFVVHGGLTQFPSLSIEELKKLPRYELPRHKDLVSRQDAILEQLLWSDPHVQLNGCIPSNRGAGVLFGSAVSSHFLITNKLKLVVRSHQKKSEGYEYHHSGLVLTVFSASYYCGINDNKGAIAVFRNGSHIPELIQYFAKYESAFAGNRHENRMANSLQQLRDRIFESKFLLAKQFGKTDAKKNGKITGRVSLGDWVNVMSHTLNLDIRWVSLQPYLCTLSDGMINYNDFLARFQVRLSKEDKKKWNSALSDRLTAAIYRHMTSLEEVFKEFDDNNDGMLSLEEFHGAVQKIDPNFSDAQIICLMEAIDTDHSGYIDIKEFRKFFQPALAEHAKFDLDVVDAVSVLAERYLEDRAGIKALFPPKKDGKKGKRCSLSIQEFTQKCYEFLGPRSPSATTLNNLAMLIDANQSGAVSYHELKRGLAGKNKKSVDSWKQDYLHRVLSVLKFSQYHLRRLFEVMDMDGNGTLDLKEFVQGMSTLNQAHGLLLSHEQIRQLFHNLDTNGDGTVDYNELLSILTVVDAGEEVGEGGDGDKDKRRSHHHHHRRHHS